MINFNNFERVTVTGTTLEELKSNLKRLKDLEKENERLKEENDQLKEENEQLKEEKEEMMLHPDSQFVKLLAQKYADKTSISIDNNNT